MNGYNDGDKLVNQIVAKVVANNNNKHVEVGGDSFFYGLFNGDAVKERGGVANLLLIIGVLLAGITVIVSLLIFSYNDVLFFKNTIHVNECGTFIPRQSSNREYALFLFNSSDVWANSGIQVESGDKVYLSASGAFNSSITQVIENVRNNTRLQYPWSTANYSSDSNDSLSIAPSYPFGAVLFTVNRDKMSCLNASAESKKSNKTEKIHALCSSCRDGHNYSKQLFNITHNGQLFFTVNDVYLSDDIYAKIKRGDNEDFKKDLPKELVDDREAWFNDNIGAILICAEIEHENGSTALTKYIRRCDLMFEKSFTCWTTGAGWFSKIYSVVLFGVAIAVTLWWSIVYLWWLVAFVAVAFMIINWKKIFRKARTLKI